MTVDETKLREIIQAEVGALLDSRLTVMEERLEKRIEAKLGNKFDTQFAKFYGMVNRRLDTLEQTKADKSQIEKLQATVEGIASRQDADDTERKFIIHQLNRHERWFGELSHSTGTVLSPA